MLDKGELSLLTGDSDLNLKKLKYQRKFHTSRHLWMETMLFCISKHHFN